MKKSDQNLGDIWDTKKYTNIHIMGIPKGQERKRKEQKEFLKKRWAKTFQILSKIINYMSKKLNKLQVG